MGIRFLALVLAWTWAFWAIPVVLPGSPWTMPSLAFLYIGGAGPMVVGLAFAAAKGRQGLRETTEIKATSPLW